MENKTVTLKAGDHLYYLSWTQGYGDNPRLNRPVLFMTPGEAIVSLFNQTFGDPIEYVPDSYWIVVVRLTADVIIDKSASPKIQNIIARADIGQQQELRYACPAGSGIFYVNVPVILRSIGTYDLNIADEDKFRNDPESLIGFLDCDGIANNYLRYLPLQIGEIFRGFYKRRQEYLKDGLTIDVATLVGLINRSLEINPKRFLAVEWIDLTLDPLIASSSEIPSNLLAKGILTPTEIELWSHIADSTVVESNQITTTLNSMLNPEEMPLPGEDLFSRVPADVVVDMALGFSLKTIVRLCQVSKRFNSTICNNDNFWLRRTVADKGLELVESNRKPPEMTWRDYYMEFTLNEGEWAVNNVQRGFTTAQILLLLILEAAHGTARTKEVRLDKLFFYLSRLMPRNSPALKFIISRHVTLINDYDLTNAETLAEMGKDLFPYRRQLYEMLQSVVPAIVSDLDVSAFGRSGEHGLQKILAGTGFGRLDVRHLYRKGDRHLQLGLLKAWKMTDPDIEPDYTQPLKKRVEFEYQAFDLF